MTREIKFRAWDKEEGCWQHMTVGQLVNAIAIGDTSALPIGDMVDEDICLFTGLHDKNGKEIYEGDIVKMYIFDLSPVPLEIITAVSFHEGTFTVIKMNEEPLSLRDAIVISNKTKQGIEIIGNIYENPELLIN